MFNHELYASAFARAVELMRPEGDASRESQKAALRALVALAELSSATIRLYDGVVSVDDIAIPDTVPHLATLVACLEQHGVEEMMIGRRTGPGELLALLRGLAGKPGEGPGVKERLRDAGSTRIMVILDKAPKGQWRAANAAQALAMEEVQKMLDDAAPPAAARRVTPGSSARGPTVDRDEVLAEWDAFYAAESGDTPNPGIIIDMGEHMPVEPGAAAGAPPEAGGADTGPPATPPPDLPVSADTPLGEALGRVVLDPYGPRVLDNLTRLSERILLSLREDQAEDALRALAILIDLEPGAPEGTARNSYGIVLKRTLSRDVLAQVAQCLHTPALVEPGGKVMRRSRADGAEILLGLLASAESIRERRTYMTALRGIPEATDRVIGMLEHPQWFVVRNVAEILGDLRVEEAAVPLGKVLDHADQRVQRAAAVALAKIGSVATVEPLRKRLREGTPEMRAMIAAAIGGPQARALAMPLVALIEDEGSAEVREEYCRALGRIGTPEAVQGLANIAQPGGRLLNRKPVALRLAAVDGLRLARAAGVLQGLTEDGDKSVRAAVQAALAEVRGSR